MIPSIKSQIKKIFKYYGYKIVKTQSRDDLEYLTKFFINGADPIIFDVGANNGQSIEKFKRLFKSPIIHSFEPNPHETNSLIKNYGKEKNIFINNQALGDKDGKSEFNINALSGHSSFKKLIPNTRWLKLRAKKMKLDARKYTINQVISEITTLDKYAKKNNINRIDILKIDTQGYEDKVLQGAEKYLLQNKIHLIQVELFFSEIYENPLQIYDIEKKLIPNNYKLFGISNSGTVLSKNNLQADFYYVSPEFYDKFKKFNF